MGDWQPFLQLGTGGVVLMFLWLIVKAGDLRTRFEVDTLKERIARAEGQVDKLLPAVEVLSKQSGVLADGVAKLIALEERRAERLGDRELDHGSHA